MCPSPEAEWNERSKLSCVVLEISLNPVIRNRVKALERGQVLYVVRFRSVRFCFAPHVPLLVLVREAALFLPLIVPRPALQKNIKRIRTEDG